METKLYHVAITETHRKIISVEAASPQQAQSRARDAYANTEVTLTDANFEGAEFHVLDSNDETTAKYPIIERKD